jgi:hypothetical protein
VTAIRCNADLVEVAGDFIRQARAIADDEPQSFARRACLYTSAGHLLLAMAPLESVEAFKRIPDPRDTIKETAAEALVEHLRVTLLERLRDDLLEHKSGADSGGHGPCHKTPAAVFAELDAAIAAESSWARFVDLQASTASVAPPPRFVEVKEARPPAATKARRVLVAIDTIDAISYEPWQVVLVVRAYTADGHPTHVTYYRNFDTEDTPDAAAAVFIALCTRTP